jgi:hypothetical protein
MNRLSGQRLSTMPCRRLASAVAVAVLCLTAAPAAATEMTVHETAHLHMLSHSHLSIIEEGYGSGTLSGRLTLHLMLSLTGGSVTFTAYPPGGTVSGRGEGTTYAKGNTAYFTGTASITSGTGKYKHASAHDVQLRGSLQRHTFAFFVELTARLRY